MSPPFPSRACPPNLQSPHFINFHKPVYYSPPSTLSFFEPPAQPPTDYPSFEQANYRSTLTPTFARGRFPAYEADAKGPLPGVRAAPLVAGAAIEGAREVDEGKDVASPAPKPPYAPLRTEPDRPPPPKRNLALSEEEVARRLEKELGL